MAFWSIETFSGWISTQKIKSLKKCSTRNFFWVDIYPESKIIGILIDLNLFLGWYPPRKLSNWKNVRLETFYGWISPQKIKLWHFDRLKLFLGGYPPRKLSHWHFDRVEINPEKVPIYQNANDLIFWLDIHPENWVIRKMFDLKLFLGGYPSRK